ncbi:hypothetical protein J2X76_005403 [Neorhizobium sp. 2083]|uniref:hypothetical protein n=1 Tax=Neorhizobium sp. 2083 TaxID=2817762 RepID=UPI00285C50A7|nr:hypothetical protein [Neorhizobium sp. 2083]MDR6820206.1 hypothetical protein [Neorhizobium sp. 2083]
MSARQAFTPEQIAALSAAVKQICAERGIQPTSKDGREIAMRLVEEYTGGETIAQMQRRLTLH